MSETDTSTAAFLKQEYERKPVDELLQIFYRANEAANDDVFELVQDILLGRGGKAVKAKVATQFLTDLVNEVTSSMSEE